MESSDKGQAKVLRALACISTKAIYCVVAVSVAVVYFKFNSFACQKEIALSGMDEQRDE